MKLLIIIISFIYSCVSLFAQEPVLKLTLHDAEQIFLKRNLSLIASKYDIDLAEAQVTQARLFENPVISLEQNVYNRLNGKYFDIGKEGEAAVEIEQVINLAGQRNKRVRLEKINREIACYQFEEVLRTLRSELNKTFVEIVFASRSLGIYDREVNSLENLLQAFELHQDKGNISLMERSRLESLLLSLRKEKSELENHIIELRCEFNLLLNMPADQHIELLLDDEVLHGLYLSFLSFKDMEGLLVSRPDLKMARSGMEAAKANLKLQRSLAAPECSLKGMYDRAGNFINNYFAVGVSLSIPIFNRNQGNIKSAKTEICKTGREEELAVEKAQMELYSAYERLQKNIDLYRTTNGKLEHNFDKLMDGAALNYQRRNISLLEFIDYYQSYKEACLQLFELKKNVFLAMEDLNMIVGQTVFNY